MPLVLFAVEWPEPIGLVLIQAMANGTPIIAFGHGVMGKGHAGRHA